MTKLHLVRHGPPRAIPALPAEAWPLDFAAVDEVMALRSAAVLPFAGRWFSSPEPKAIATAELLAASPAQVVDEFREAQRPHRWLPPGDFAALVRRSVEHPDVPAGDGWEAATRTQQRVVEAVQRICADSAGEVVLVGHGTAWTLLVAALTGRAPDMVAWEQMLLPDHCALASAGRGPWQVTSSWGAWREG